MQTRLHIRFTNGREEIHIPVKEILEKMLNDGKHRCILRAGVEQVRNDSGGTTPRLVIITEEFQQTLGDMEDRTYG